ncbi:MAG: lytic transglycosylase domain-containing protein [Bacteroidales bacterium]|jgi:Predicted soluble lytic transglycosylase fused to an ABC-type amino acid-binding protein|nr:lytic transglycosylase domain-containing protein [Bacteroidales bacterium]MBR3012861.1 lytic transglycosylase domain-containing protein [Bacteroidales bacterium]
MKMKKLPHLVFIGLFLSCFISYAQPRVPDYVVFAGDTIRFDRADLRERMDRELIAFCYSHTNSKLMIKRANRYFPQIEPLLKAGGVPDDLKYLMVIESNVDPKAVSSAGAAGFWQFMKETGKGFGLVVDNEVDERYNLEKATLAACKYFKQAKAKYKDWMTVAASYNAGQGGISKRLTDQHQSSAMDLWLVEETSRYMFRILAAKLYFQNPAAFGFTFTREELYPYIPPREEVEVSGPIEDLAAFAEKYGVSYFDLKNANLWLRDSKLVNKERKTYYIAIPDVEAEKYDPSQTRVHSMAWVRTPPMLP